MYPEGILLYSHSLCKIARLVNIKSALPAANCGYKVEKEF